MSVWAAVITFAPCLLYLVTTPRPTDGVDVYFEKPADDTEHANFLRAKTDLEERRMKRINEVTLTSNRDRENWFFCWQDSCREAECQPEIQQGADQCHFYICYQHSGPRPSLTGTFSSDVSHRHQIGIKCVPSRLRWGFMVFFLQLPRSWRNGQKQTTNPKICPRQSDKP